MDSAAIYADRAAAQARRTAAGTISTPEFLPITPGSTTDREDYMSSGSANRVAP